MTAEIIFFPIKNTRIPPSETEAQSAIDTMKSNHINETLVAIAPMLFERLHTAGFDFSSYNSETELKYGSFVIEAMHSLLCKYYSLYHPFQKIAEQIFVRTDDQEFTIANELNIELLNEHTTE